jgi:radical SAM superfamily enzyme YgiQ (UPF0313 family)
MIERKIKKHWSAMAAMNIANNDEVLEYAARSGCRLIFLGVEAESSSALKDMDKKLNLKIGPENYEEVFRRIHQHGIAVMGAFIYGMDSDTPESLRNRTEYILNSGVDAVEITTLTPISPELDCLTGCVMRRG